MFKNANEVSKINKLPKDIEEKIKEYVDYINSEILKNSAVKTTVTVILPKDIVMASPMFNKEIIFIMVYGTIIENLKKNGYDVTITQNGDRVLLTISWKLILEDKYIEYLRGVIKSAFVTQKN